MKFLIVTSALFIISASTWASHKIVEQKLINVGRCVQESKDTQSIQLTHDEIRLNFEMEGQKIGKNFWKVGMIGQAIVDTHLISKVSYSKIVVHREDNKELSESCNLVRDLFLAINIEQKLTNIGECKQVGKYHSSLPISYYSVVISIDGKNVPITNLDRRGSDCALWDNCNGDYKTLNIKKASNVYIKESTQDSSIYTAYLNNQPANDVCNNIKSSILKEVSL